MAGLAQVGAFGKESGVKDDLVMASAVMRVAVLSSHAKEIALGLTSQVGRCFQSQGQGIRKHFSSSNCNAASQQAY